MTQLEDANFTTTFEEDLNVPSLADDGVSSDSSSHEGGAFLNLGEVNESTSSGFESESLDEISDVHVGRLESLVIDETTPKAANAK